MSAAGWLSFVIAAAAGAVLRHFVGGVVADRTTDAFPWGTLVVNATGSLLSGFVAGRSVILATGFCGAYTTFSAFTFDTVRLLEKGDLRSAFSNVGATFVTCAMAAGAGMALAAVV